MSIITRTTIWVTFQREGIHRYPAATNLKGVEFLASDHRHIFHFRVELQVFHDDREVEFILFKRELEALYSKDLLQLDHKSCEMIAKDIFNYLDDSPIYGGRSRYVDIQVSEDGENGASINGVLI